MTSIKIWLQRRNNMWTSLIILLLLGLNGIATFYGRIYFPYNFRPEEVSFLENYIVLTMVTSIIVLMLIAMYLLFDNEI
jgi:uncharacterized membrane-anchored protein